MEQTSFFLEQTAAVANQTAAQAVVTFGTVQDIQGYIDAGYTAITSEMSTSQIQSLLTEGAKLVLADDITLTATLNFSADNITFNGNGHTISYAGNGGFTISANNIVASKSAIKVSGNDAHISHVTIAYTNVKEQGAAVTIDGGRRPRHNRGVNTASGRRCRILKLLSMS